MASNIRDHLLHNLGATIGVLNDASQTIVKAADFSIEPHSIQHPTPHDLRQSRDFLLFKDGLIYMPRKDVPVGLGRIIVTGVERGHGPPALFLYTNPSGEPCTRCRGSGIEP
jgi:hypothetical protein